MSGSQRILSTVKCPVCSAGHLPIKGSLNNDTYACTCENCGHFFKFKAIRDVKSTVTFTINGVEYTVGNEYDPATSLVEFMRKSGASVGTKGCCYEGGCGVCLVAVKLLDPITMKEQFVAVNSCCLQLFTCDGMEIITVEGLGDPKKGLHAIQDRLAKHDGAQCGFCSPGQVMNMYGILQKSPKPTVQQIEDEFDATICRCTGYRAILDAMKSFAVDAPAKLKGRLIDIEELDTKMCSKTGQACRGHCSGGHKDGCRQQISRPVHIVGAGAQWIKPANFSDLLAAVNTHRKDNYRLVFGNTGYGAYQDFGPWNFDILIDIRGVKELYAIEVDTNIVLGANLSISSVIDVFEQAKGIPVTKYGQAFADHLKRIAHHGIRNLSCWAGNLMLKRSHPEFPSDVFTLWETVGAKLTIYDGDGSHQLYSLGDFLKLDMKGKVISAVNLPSLTTSDVQIKTYRASQRLQGSQPDLTAGFNFSLDASKNFFVTKTPSIVIQGINSQMIHAMKTEHYLDKKALGDPTVLKFALNVLAAELVPESFPAWTSPTYRKSMALALLYRFALDVCKSKADPSYASGGQDLVRTPIVGSQDFDTVKPEWPLTEPIPKMAAPYLVSGQAKYLDDLPRAPGELSAAVVISSIGNASIDKIDPSAALKIPGVVAFFQASDIPKGGANNWRPKGIFMDIEEELLSTGRINFAGQPIGIVVADTETTAQTAASMVNVTYKDNKPVIVDIQDGIQKKSFSPTSIPPIKVGDAKGAISKSKHQISGGIAVGDQFHFHLETQTSICTPTDLGGMEVKASTQWLDGVAETVAQVLGLPQSDVTATVHRLGGAFGGKITQNFLVSGLCALAAYKVGKPVKLHLDIHTNMKMLGKRTAYYAEYQVGSDANGKLEGLNITIYGDVGWQLSMGESALYSQEWFDNAYYCPNWLFSPVAVLTNKPLNTACRSPGSAPFIFIMESIMEHLAKSLNMDQLDVRKANLYTKGQKTPSGMVLEYCTIREVVAKLEADIKLATRKQAVSDFNKANRWKKRGLSVMPNRFGIGWGGAQYNTHVIIYHGDGSVAIAHGGIDVGQGIHTKVIQVCAYEFGIPMDKVRVKTSSSVINANSITTGGSIASELCCKGVVEACKILKQRMAPVKASMKDPTWEELVAKCYEEMVDLTASYMTHASDPGPSHYNCYSAACVEAELDVLTGQYQLRQLDMLYDCGQSMNPELDIGQAEGGFVMGLGYYLQEKMRYDSKTGEVLNASTWNYKPPLAKDLPMNFNFAFQKNAPNPLGVLSSKAVGEPPLTLAAAALFAIKHGVEAARAEIGQDAFFPLNAPATQESVQKACMTDVGQFTFGKSGKHARR